MIELNVAWDISKVKPEPLDDDTEEAFTILIKRCVV